MKFTFSSRLRSEQVAAKLGAWLGLSFTVAFVTGLFSHSCSIRPTGCCGPPARSTSTGSLRACT